MLITQMGGVNDCKSRDCYIDIIKGWAILLVVIGHIDNTCVGQLYSWLLGSWKLAIFFMVAGFYMKDEKLCNPLAFLKGKVKSLYMPALIIYGLAVLLHNVFITIGWYPADGVHPVTGAPVVVYGIKEIAIGLAKVFCCAGSGELVMGAMWFLYVLMYSMVGLAILYWILGKLVRDLGSRNMVMLILLFVGAIASGIMTKKVGITISRVNVTFTAMFLIWVGKMVQQGFSVKYNHWGWFIVSILVIVQSILFMKVHQNLAWNEYPDLMVMVVGGWAAIYVLGFIGKKIQFNFIGKFIALMGRDSLYIMAFHILGFFICNSLLRHAGFFEIDAAKGTYTYCCGNRVVAVLCYIVFGVAVPLLIMWGWRKVKRIIINRRVR